jgi:hypothetical protein
VQISKVLGFAHIYLRRKVMKKKLSILLAFVTALTLFTGCGGSGSTVVEMDAAYQLMDVSKFNFGDLTPGIQKGDRVALEESDARLEKACTYEELATYFTAVKVKSAEIADYFTLELVSVDNDNNRVVLHLKDGYYAVGQIEMMFKIDGSTEYRNYDQIYEEYCIGDVPKDDTQWTADVLKEAKFGTETFLYQFNPTDEIVSNKDGKQIIYVATQCENSLGKYTLVEEYEINPTEISFMLRVMNDKNIIKADGSLKVPESETPETEAPETSETPETETPESETPETPDTDPAPDVPSGGLEGTYWLMKHHYPGDVNEYIIASGFYLDGNGKKIIIDNMKVSEKTYDHVETEAVNSGTGYVIYSSEGYGDGLYVLKDDGKLYRSSFDGTYGSSQCHSDKRTDARLKRTA